MKTQCVDQVVGDILASWRYDISGIFPEMRGDYEAHFAECEYCRQRRHLHRSIDIGLFAFAVIRYLKPQHAFLLEVGSLAGFAVSALIWLGVAVATPAPIVMVDVARIGARRVHDRLPEKIRERIPEEIWVRISGES
jgi:hypothetical protein